MPLPLVWLGAATLSALTVKTLADDRKQQHQKRKHYRTVQTLASLAPHESPIATYPSDLLATEQRVKPSVGAIVCCGIGGVLEHTGIWVEENTIIELDGNGLVNAMSATRFTKERSGKHIYIACDSAAQPLGCEKAAERAAKRLFTLQKYHLLNNNCHQFIWQCFQPNAQPLSTFKSLNLRLAEFFDRKIYWDLCDVDIALDNYS